MRFDHNVASNLRFYKHTSETHSNVFSRETSLVSSCFVILPTDITAKDVLSLIGINKFVLFFPKLATRLELHTWCNSLPLWSPKVDNSVIFEAFHSFLIFLCYKMWALLPLDFLGHSYNWGLYLLLEQFQCFLYYQQVFIALGLWVVHRAGYVCVV